MWGKKETGQIVQKVSYGHYSKTPTKVEDSGEDPSPSQRLGTAKAQDKGH